MVELKIEIGDLPALSYALAKGREGIEAAMLTAAQHDMSERTSSQLTRHLEAIERIKGQLEEGKIV